MNFLRNHQHDHILNYDIDHYCKNWNQLIRFEYLDLFHNYSSPETLTSFLSIMKFLLRFAPKTKNGILLYIVCHVHVKHALRTLKLVLRPTSDSTSPFSSDLVVIQDGERISSHTHPFLFEGYVKGDR